MGSRPLSVRRNALGRNKKRLQNSGRNQRLCWAKLNVDASFAEEAMSGSWDDAVLRNDEERGLVSAWGCILKMPHQRSC
jgi:hypothetical protein